METDEDTVMGDPQKRPSLPSHPSLNHLPPPTHLSSSADPALAPSALSQNLPASPSPGSETPQTSDSIGPDGMPRRRRRGSSRGNVAARAYGPAESLPVRRDSLLEPNSDWSDDEKVKAKAGLPVGSLPTGYCYDPRMRYHCEVRPTADVHPEDPRRIYYIFKEFCLAGLVNHPEATHPLAPQTMVRIHARDATEEEIVLVHTEAHYAFVQSTKDMSDGQLVDLEHNRDSIYFNKLTFASSLLSAGGAIETCKAVAQRKVKNAIAVVRPPGHHAEYNKTMGFCLFNNVSVAARVCQKEPNCRKIMILDWDVHHGNGIQKAFYNDPNVLYISIHVHQNGKFYPGGDEGDWDHCGEGPGLGKNINIPWPDQGMGDGDYMFAFQQVVMPIAQEFDPDMVIVAAGFDAAAGDVLGGCFVSPPCYAQMTHMLMTLANGKVAICLEGGYNFRSISKSALAVAKTLMGEPPERLLVTSATEHAIGTVRQVAAIQSQYWRCMFPKAPAHSVWADRLHDILRTYQSKQLYDKHKLTPLYIYRTGISKSFENQVLASPNYYQKVPLVVIFHDPPEIMSQPHPVTNRLEAHNTWMADVQREYIAWIVSKGYGVIDVNIPKHVTKEPASGKYEKEDEDRPSATEELASYLWDNYIEPNDTGPVFFVGIGNAFFGVANLLMNREGLYKHINGVISFVAETPVRAIASHTQTWLSKWYRENSLVFVSSTHGLWVNTERKQHLRRYGGLVKSPSSGLSEMMAQHKDRVFDWLAERADAEPEEEEEEEDADKDTAMKD
ncbi:histone deacetylase Hda1 [Penicillium alfredii]|uniref:Histone deacetylase n=1 Tax=Penicillium alfredii TaxID=1506179 RepID=A0A9W9KFX8_9EURO|nr:histone deacetylase Hda1 [Penicillium alfredii]KAJ5104326.1 histone deacetylase Hda1 [Penicillium alfredii]